MKHIVEEEMAITNTFIRSSMQNSLSPNTIELDRLDFISEDEEHV